MTLSRQRLLAAATVSIAAPVILHWRYPKLVNSQYQMLIAQATLVGLVLVSNETVFDRYSVRRLR